MRENGGNDWTRTDHLVADVFHALTGQPHPAKPTAKAASEPDRARALKARLEAQKKRLAAQREQSP